MPQEAAFSNREVAPHSERINQSNQLATLQVLAVDDDDDNLLLIQCALELIGIDCVVAQSGKEAMQIASQKNFSLIFLDVLLPDMNGTRVLQWIRKHTATRQIPVIAVTALGRSEDRDRILQAGFTDYLLKPYMLEDLSTIVSKYLHRRGKR